MDRAARLGAQRPHLARRVRTLERRQVYHADGRIQRQALLVVLILRVASAAARASAPTWSTPGRPCRNRRSDVSSRVASCRAATSPPNGLERVALTASVYDGPEIPRLGRYSNARFVLGVTNFPGTAGHGGSQVDDFLVRLSHLLQTRSRATMAEYVIVLGIITVTLIFALGALGGSVTGALGRVTSDL